MLEVSNDAKFKSIKEKYSDSFNEDDEEVQYDFDMDDFIKNYTETIEHYREIVKQTISLNVSQDIIKEQGNEIKKLKGEKEKVESELNKYKSKEHKRKKYFRAQKNRNKNQNNK